MNLKHVMEQHLLKKSGDKRKESSDDLSQEITDPIPKVTLFEEQNRFKKKEYEDTFHAPVSRSKKSFSLRSPPPSQHLKKILSNYPEGPQIFKEVLQNADDACASAVGILLDERNLMDSSFYSECPEVLKRFLGPSLIFHNDALFNENDWDALQNMFESHKLDSPGKIGRFGMGSRSYFHLTDLVTVVSGNRIAFLDPDWIITTDGGDTETLEVLNQCHQIKQEKKNQEFKELMCLNTLLRCLHHVFGFEYGDAFYNGTLLRLPLRSGRWARRSTFAPYEYTVEKIKQLLEKFKQEAPSCLLFLQSLYCIQFWRWPEDEDWPFQTYAIFLRSTTAFNQNIKEGNKSRSSIQNFFVKQKAQGIDLKTSLCQADTGHLPEIEDIFHVDEIVYPGRPLQENDTYDLEITTQLWLINIRLVCNSDLVSLVQFSHCPPIIGIAVATGSPVKHYLKKIIHSPCRNTIDFSQPPFRQCLKPFEIALLSVEKEDSEVSKPNYQGLAFTYLPLPDIETGLPIHIHGTFQLTDNRRSLWMALKDTEGQAKKWSQWNNILLSFAIPQLYARVLTRFAQLTTKLLDAVEEQKQKKLLQDSTAEALCRYFIEHYYNAWPDAHTVTPVFQPLLNELTRYVKDQKLMIREPQSLLKVSKRLATSLDLQNCEAVTSRLFQRDNKNLPPLKPAEALFLDLTGVEAHVFTKNEACLYEAVAQCQLLGNPVVLVPEKVKHLLHYVGNNTKAFQSKSINSRLGLCELRTKQTKSHSATTGSSARRTLVTYIDVFSRVLLPHWSTLPPQELRFVPHFKNLMLYTCKILGRGPDKDILQFQSVCSRLMFVPLEIPGVFYDEEENLILKKPSECFDPSLSHLNIACLAQPAKDFRAPDVLRVLRSWGLKKSLRWDEMAQEAVTRVCVVGGCKGTLDNPKGKA